MQGVQENEHASLLSEGIEEMKVIELEQGTDQWREARAGSLGASQVALALARTKSGWGASRDNLRAQLVVERLTGQPADGFQSAAMVWGIETEPQARAAYEFMKNIDVQTVGMVLHPTIGGTHASPDGLVDGDGLLEIKCPESKTHIDTLLGKTVPSKYVTQMQWQMSCTGRQWCDFVSFDPRLPSHLSLFVKRVHRDEKFIGELEREVEAFLKEVSDTVADLEAYAGAA